MELKTKPLHERIMYNNSEHSKNKKEKNGGDIFVS